MQFFGLGPEIEARIKTAVADSRQRLVRDHSMQLELELRIALHGSIQKLANPECAGVQHSPEPQVAGKSATEAVGARPEVLHGRDHLLGLLEEHSPGRCENHP